MAQIRPAHNETTTLLTEPDERGPREEPEPPPKVTVLIAVYNREPALRRCLAALESSDERKTFEVIVVDCGSVDGSGQLDSDFPDITVLRLPRNMGRTKARNIGTRTAKGKYLLLLEPEVEVRPSTIPALISRLDSDENALAVCPLLVDAHGQTASRSGPLPEPAALYQAWASGQDWAESTLPIAVPRQAPMEVECPDPAAVAIRKLAVTGMNYFDERYGEFGSDLELATQAYRASKRILLLRDVTALVRRGEDRWSPSTAGAQTCLAADYGNGIAAYVGKYYGWAASFKMRLRMLLQALVSLQFGLLSLLIGGQKIDGTQQSI